MRQCVLPYYILFSSFFPHWNFEEFLMRHRYCHKAPKGECYETYYPTQAALLTRTHNYPLIYAKKKLPSAFHNTIHTSRSGAERAYLPIAKEEGTAGPCALPTVPLGLCVHGFAPKLVLDAMYPALLRPKSFHILRSS
jgi:hypothetical protein